jgi:LysR family transcriptional regulator, cyn operon transcriptional activator
MTERKLDYIHFLDGPGTPGAREAGVVNHASMADIDTVMRVSIAWRGKMRAHRRFNRESRRPASLCGRRKVLLRVTVRAHGTNVSPHNSPRHEAAVTLPQANLMGEAAMPRGAYEVMDLKSLMCFFAVARRGSLTKAGIELDIAEAAVSQRVKSLETYLGTKLYEARGGKVHLTAAGELTAQLAVSIFGDIQALEQAVGGAQETDEIVLASHDSVLRHWLPERMEAFHRAHPLARLRLIARPIAETLRLVRFNECDLGVISEAQIPPELTFHAIATYPAYLLLPKGHALARRARDGFQAMLSDAITGRYPLVILEVQREDSRLREAFERHNVPFTVAFEVSTIDTLKHYVARGMGIAVISGFSVTQEDRARLEVIEIPEEMGGTNRYGVVVRRDKHRTALLKALIALLAGAP